MVGSTDGGGRGGRLGWHTYIGRVVEGEAQQLRDCSG